MLKPVDMDELEEKTYQLLEEVGIAVESEKLSQICLQQGCSPGNDHRIRIPRRIIADMVHFQKRTLAQYERDHELVLTCGPDWAHHLMWTRQADRFRERYRTEFLMQAFDCGPSTLLDHASGARMPVNGDVFAMMMKFAEATPEIGYTSTWYRQDLPARIERIDSLVNGLKLTRKLDGIECINPEVIKYFKEASEIIYGDADTCAFLAGSECMTMPLILERRSAEDILERRRCGVHRYHVASMPTLGISTPATLAGSIVMGAAELLGGMAICWCADPKSDLSARMITLVADMRNGNSTTFGPAYAQYDCAVRQLFHERWGGHCMVEVFFSPTAQKPGLQAVFENYYGTSMRRRWEGNPAIPYAGMGTLGNGGIGSPVQFMLDMEIRKAEWAYRAEIPVTPETLDWEEVLEMTRTRGDFLSSDHTMRHHRELWNSPLFRSESPFEGPWDGTEKAILDACDARWRANLAKWTPPEWPRETTKALDELLARARREFEVD
jgi:trimethylamine:corrinoid methyltransferase-like protein